MEDKIIKTEEEFSIMKVVMQDGTIFPINAKTTYTIWDSGRKDCAIELEKPLISITTKEN